MIDGVLAALDDALTFREAVLILRSQAATAEVVAGGPVRRRQEWLTLGDEGGGASHVHLRIAVDRLPTNELPGGRDLRPPRLAALRARFRRVAEVPA